MKNSAPNHAANGRKKITIIILAIIAVVAIIAALVINLTGKNKSRTNDGESQTTTESGGTDQTGDTSSEPEDSEAQTRASEDVQTQIQALVTQYRTAFANADIEALKTIYNTNEVMNSDVITATAKIITGYQNTECYIKNGLDDASKVVFVYDDLKIDGIDTLIPNIAYIYVRQKEDGSYYIYPGEYDRATSDYVYSSDIQKYISELIKDADINSLYASANEKMTKAMNDDPEVKAFVDQLTAGEATDQTGSGASQNSGGASQTSQSSTADSDSASPADSSQSTSPADTADSDVPESVSQSGL